MCAIGCFGDSGLGSTEHTEERRAAAQSGPEQAWIILELRSKDCSAQNRNRTRNKCARQSMPKKEPMFQRQTSGLMVGVVVHGAFNSERCGLKTNLMCGVGWLCGWDWITKKQKKGGVNNGVKVIQGAEARVIRYRADNHTHSFCDTEHEINKTQRASIVVVYESECVSRIEEEGSVAI